MPPFVHSLDVVDVRQIVEHFQAVPDMMEFTLESDRYPYAALNDALKTLHDAVEQSASQSQETKTYRRTITKIESVLSTRVDYVKSIIDQLLGKDTFEPLEISLDDSPTPEILSHIDLMKDVAHSPEINQKDYKNALRKLIKSLKFRFNKGLEIHKKLYHLEFEDIAEDEGNFPQTLLEEQKGFLEDALTMTRNHVPVTATQIHQLKETLFKILESMGVRVLQSNHFQYRAEYCRLMQQVEYVVLGAEVDFGQKVARRFADMLPEYISEQWNSNVIKHNRKLVALLIDLTEDSALLEELYQILVMLTTAEAGQLRKKQEIARVTLKHIQTLEYVKDHDNAEQVEMERFRNMDLSEKARDLIKLSLYGLCEYLTAITVDELRKYPIGILRSAEKVLRDLEQHRLKVSDSKNLQDSPEYGHAVDTVKEAMLTYNSSNDKHNFVDIYKESDYTKDGVTYCVFNDIILRSIQNITEAYFVVDSNDQPVSDNRLTELQITIAERYKAEWIRQNAIEQQIEQEAMEELAGELV
jgi:hypothetical protein